MRGRGKRNEAPTGPPGDVILVECKPDEALVRVLGMPRRKIRHCTGKIRVCRELEKAESGLGLVDEDPRSAQPALH